MKKALFIAVLVICMGFAYSSQAQDPNFAADTLGLGTIEADPNTGKLYEITIDVESGKIVRLPMPELESFLKKKIMQHVDSFNSFLKDLFEQPEQGSTAMDVTALKNKKKNIVLPQTLELFINNGKEMVTEEPVLRRASKDASKGVWYYVDGGVKKDVSQKRLIPMLVIGNYNPSVVIGSCQNGTWYEYKDVMTSTTKANLKAKYPEAKEAMGYLVSAQLTTPAAKVQVASINSAGRKYINNHKVETYLNNVIKSKSYKHVELDWSGCKFGKFKQVNDSTYECVAQYCMSFRGYSSDMFMIYGDKTYKSIKVTIIRRKNKLTEEWLIRFGDIKVENIERLGNK